VGQSLQNRPAGRFVTLQDLPQGLSCRASYGDLGEREAWDPVPQWRGEKSYHPNTPLQADENRQWYHFDAEGKVLGHLAQEIAAVLRGKDNPLYDPIRDVGAFVVITNCDKVRVSGKKFHYKLYFRNLSYRPGHMRIERFKDLQKRFPERILMRAVWGSMPRTPSSRRIFKERLKLFQGPNHLYYHENPVEYPMHKIKDCTHSQNLKRKNRIGHWATRWNPRMMLKREQDEKTEDAYKLKKFQKFLKDQYDDLGPEAMERMELDEAIKAGEANRIKTILEENEGKDIQKRPANFYLGTSLPRQKLGGPRFKPRND